MNPAEDNIFAKQTLQEWLRSAAHRVGGITKLAVALDVPVSVLSEFWISHRRIRAPNLLRGIEALARSEEELEQARALVELYEAGRDGPRRDRAGLWVESGVLFHDARLDQPALEVPLHSLALRELSDGRGGALDHAGLGARLRPARPAAEVDAALTLLAGAGLLVRDEDGRWRRGPRPRPAASVQLMPPQLQAATLEAQRLAVESLADVPAAERAYELLIPTVPIEELPWLRLELRRLLGRVLVLCERARQVGSTDEPVYALLTQLVPLTWPVTYDGAPSRASPPTLSDAPPVGAPSALLYDDYHDFVRGWVSAWKEEERLRLMAAPEGTQGSVVRTNGALAKRLTSALKRSGSPAELEFAHKERLQKFISELLQEPGAGGGPGGRPRPVVQIDPVTISAWGAVLGLTPYELMYFSASVYRQRDLARGHAETAQVWADVMSAVRQIGLAAGVPSDTVAKVGHWLPVVLSELLFHPNFQEDPAWVLGLMRQPGITEADVRAALVVLEGAGLTVRDAEGRLRPARPRSVSMGPGELPIAARDLYRSVLELGRWTDVSSGDERPFGLGVVQVPAQAREVVREELRVTRELIQGRLDAALEGALSSARPGEGGVQVMAMTCCWFPLTR